MSVMWYEEDFTDEPLPTLEMKVNQKYRHLKDGKQEEWTLPHSLQKECRPAWFKLVQLFWTYFRFLISRCLNNKFVLFEVTKLVVICYSANRKLIQRLFCLCKWQLQELSLLFKVTRWHFLSFFFLYFSAYLLPYHVSPFSETPSSSFLTDNNFSPSPFILLPLSLLFYLIFLSLFTT